MVNRLDGGRTLTAEERARINAGQRQRAAQGQDTYRPPVVLAPPTAQSIPTPTLRGTPSVGGGGGGGGGGGYSEAAAAQARAVAAARSASQRENDNTQSVIDALLKSLDGYAGGRDTQLRNADRNFQTSLTGIAANYANAVADYDKTAISNEQDESAKTAANIANRARERMSLLTQAASQGAGETDQLRAQIQAFMNSDANQSEIARSFFDTQRSINSQLAGANSQAETSRRSAWQQLQEGRGTAWQEYWKNYSDTWTNIQRTRASNNNIESETTVGFNANTRGLDPTEEASKYAGKAYDVEQKDEDFFKKFDGRKEERKSETNSQRRAAMTTIAAPKAAEGATLRGRW